jgi:hypothetical protein
MDRSALVETLRDLFKDKEKIGGLTIDAIGLAPAYSGIATNSFVLGVSAPGMNGRDCYEKADRIIEILFAHTSVDVRRMINRVRVYDSKDELRSYAANDFDRNDCDVCERPVTLNAQTFEMEMA